MAEEAGEQSSEPSLDGLVGAVKHEAEQLPVLGDLLVKLIPAGVAEIPDQLVCEEPGEISFRISVR